MNNNNNNNNNSNNINNNRNRNDNNKSYEPPSIQEGLRSVMEAADKARVLAVSW